MITDAVGDCVGLIRERTAGEEAIIAWQGTYEPYGALVTSHSRVVHPHLRAGHKGLFAERLDGGVVTGWAGIETPRLTPISTLMYHNRSRTYVPGLGRFLQSDPNAGGLAVVASVPHGGRGAGLTVLGADLSALTGDGVHLYQYVRGNPVAGRDPTGLFSGIDALTGSSGAVDIYSDYNESVIGHGSDLYGAAAGMLHGAAAQQEMLVEAATDWSVSDDMFMAMLMANRPAPTQSPILPPSGGVVLPVMAGAPKWLQPVLNPVRVAKGLASYNRRHGGIEHMTKMWQLVKTFRKMIKDSGGKFQPQMMRHNQALVGPNGQTVTNLRPDVQILDVINKTLYIGESLVTSGGDSRRLPDMIAAFKKAYPDWKVVTGSN